MADRTKYWHEYYLRNKERSKANTYRWLEAKKSELGDEGFAEWKRNENAKYRARKKQARRVDSNNK